jgi:hypothetical protein
MKKTLAIAVSVLLSSPAWADYEFLRGNPDTMDHILLDLPQPTKAMSAPMSEPREFYGTSQPVTVIRYQAPDLTTQSRGHEVATDVYGSVLLDVQLTPRVRLQRFRLVGRFPGEFRFVTAEVAVGGGLAVDRAQQVEHLHDAFRAQVEVAQ